MGDDNIACAVAGITADANILINYARLCAQRYTYQYQEPQPVEQLVQGICDLKQGYTQYGGLRPFGVSFLYAGWDKHFGFQLYHSDPSGNNTSAQSILKQEYKDNLDTKQVLALAVKVLRKTMDSTSLTAENLEFATLTLVDGKPSFHSLTADEITNLLQENTEEESNN